MREREKDRHTYRVTNRGKVRKSLMRGCQKRFLPSEHTAALNVLDIYKDNDNNINSL